IQFAGTPGCSAVAHRGPPRRKTWDVASAPHPLLENARMGTRVSGNLKLAASLLRQWKLFSRRRLLVGIRLPLIRARFLGLRGARHRGQLRLPVLRRAHVSVDVVLAD